MHPRGAASLPHINGKEILITNLPWSSKTVLASGLSSPGLFMVISESPTCRVRVSEPRNGKLETCTPVGWPTNSELSFHLPWFTESEDLLPPWPGERGHQDTLEYRCHMANLNLLTLTILNELAYFT